MSESIGTLAQDETPPIVVHYHPGGPATNVPINTVITATFSEPMDALLSMRIRLSSSLSDPIDGVISL